MQVDDRDDEQRVLDQLREILEGVEKKENARMMAETAMRIVIGVVLVVVAAWAIAWFCGL